METQRKNKTFGKRIVTVVAALGIGLSGAAFAEGDHDHDHDRDRAGPGGGDHVDHGRAPPQQQRGHDRGPGAGPDHRFNRGDRLPAEWRGHEHVVSDWRGHHLNAPPRGYQWMDVGGGDFVLAAITTGIIASILLNH